MRSASRSIGFVHVSRQEPQDAAAPDSCNHAATFANTAPSPSRVGVWNDRAFSSRIPVRRFLVRFGLRERWDDIERLVRTRTSGRRSLGRGRSPGHTFPRSGDKQSCFEDIEIEWRAVVAVGSGHTGGSFDRTPAFAWRSPFKSDPDGRRQCQADILGNRRDAGYVNRHIGKQHAEIDQGLKRLEPWRQRECTGKRGDTIVSRDWDGLRRRRYSGNIDEQAVRVLQNVVSSRVAFVWKLMPRTANGRPGYLPICKWPARQYFWSSAMITILTYLARQTREIKLPK